MNEKQIYWIYDQFKSLVLYSQGRPLNLDSVAEIYETIEKINDVTKKSREENPGIDKEVTEFIKCFMRIVQACEMLNKPL